MFPSLFLQLISFGVFPFLDAPSGPEYPGYYGRDAERGMPRVGRDADPIEASYERYLRSGVLNFYFILRLVS